MESNLILITLSAVLLLWSYNRYMILTDKMALKERQKLTDKIGKFIDENEKVSYELKEDLLYLHHISMTNSLLKNFIYAGFFKKSEALESDKKTKDKYSESEYNFLKSCIADMFKINFLYSPMQYILYGLILFVAIFFILILALISSKLIGGFKAVDKFINKDTDFYISSFNFHRL